jgi:hypothetical protein
LYLATPTYFRPSFVVIFTSFVVNITSNVNYFKGNYYDSTHPRSDSLPSGKNGVEGDGFHQMEKEQNDLFWRLTKNDLISIGILFHPDLIVKPNKPFVNVFDTHKLTPLLHKDVVESTACPHQKAVSTFLPPAQAPPQLPARRVLQLGERGFCPGGRASWPGGRITSPVE